MQLKSIIISLACNPTVLYRLSWPAMLGAFPVIEHSVFGQQAGSTWLATSEFNAGGVLQVWEAQHPGRHTVL